MKDIDISLIDPCRAKGRGTPGIGDDCPALFEISLIGCSNKVLGILTIIYVALKGNLIAEP
jgi:hypothetical protein